MRFHVHYKGAALIMAAGVALMIMMEGCSGSPRTDSAQQEEITRLQTENAGLPQARKEHQEFERLSKELDGIHKLRAQRQELARLRKENEQLRAQLAKASSASSQNIQK